MLGQNQKFPLYAVLVVVAGVVVTLVLMVSARAKINRNQTATITSTNLPQNLRRGPVQVVRFTLYDAGIYPSEAHAQPGLVAVSIEDLSGASSGLVIERREGKVSTLLGRVERLQDRLRARGEILMTLGHYDVYDASRPDNRAVLIVEP